MGRLARLLLVFVAILMPWTASAQTVFQNVTVLTMEDGRAIENGVVIVEGDRITAVGTTQEIAVPERADIIDGAGGYIVPGLAEMHGHLPGWTDSPNAPEDILFLYVAGGVTTVRGMLGDPVQMELRQKIADGEIIGPNLYLAAPSLNGNNVDDPLEGAERVRRYAAAGWDLQKVHGGLTREQFDAIMDAANALEFPVGGHVSADVGIVHTLERGQSSIDHLDGYISWLDGEDRALTPADLDRAVEETLKHDVWIVPTQALFNLFFDPIETDTLLARDELKYMHPDTVASWARRMNGLEAAPVIAENRQRLLKALADGGVRIALGSDAPQLFSVPGFSIWREIDTMAAAGMTAEQILDAGSVQPGAYFVDHDRFGMIKPGQRADLLLLDGDPVSDIDNIKRQRGVMVAGRWYSRELIDARLADLAARMQTAK